MGDSNYFALSTRNGNHRIEMHIMKTKRRRENDDDDDTKKKKQSECLNIT